MNFRIFDIKTVDVVNDKNVITDTKASAVRFNSDNNVSVTVVFDENSLESLRKARCALAMIENFLESRL